MMLKEGGSLLIDTIGNKPIDEDIDLLPDAGGSLSLFYRSLVNIICNNSMCSTRAAVLEVYKYINGEASITGVEIYCRSI